MAEAGYFDYQMHRIAKDLELRPHYSPYAAILRMTTNEMIKGWFR